MILFYIILLAGVVSNSKEAEVVKPALPATCALRSCGTANQGSSGGNVGAPKIVKNQRVIETSIGNLLIFSCKLRNDSPAAKIKWKFKSIQSKKYVDIKPPAVEDPFVINKVIIASVSKKDVGSYKCIATNEAGQDEHIFEVKIKAPATEPPQIDKTFRMFRATAKYPFALNCKIVGGHPATQITWQYRKRQNAQYKKLKQKGEVLMFKSAQISDTGYYRCVAVNEAGTDSHVMRLYVKETFKRSRIEGTGDELIQKSKLRPPMKRNKQRKPRKGWSSTDSESDSDSSSDSNILSDRFSGDNLADSRVKRQSDGLVFNEEANWQQRKGNDIDFIIIIIIVIVLYSCWLPFLIELKTITLFIRDLTMVTKI
ncbi:brother of CDO-like [Choristoneura fumiferana]|uniref:brother of CDO-like n=1 Tax=Choristoneura fumiferana TaxID=7141 RepID=UPI003D15791E